MAEIDLVSGEIPAIATTDTVGALAATTTTTDTRGAMYQAVYTVRQVRIYAMNESDLENVAMFSTITTGAASVASGAIGWILNIWWEIATTPPTTGASPTTLGVPIVQVLLALVVLCIAIGGWAQWRKHNRLVQIKSESRVVG